MNSEEYLDRLIEQHENGREPLHIIDDEVTVSLAAARVLARLNEIDVPPNFAHKLELSIRSRARDLARQNDSSHSTRPLLGTLPSSGTLRTQRSQPRRTWISALGIAAALLMACVGILTTSAHSMPGDALYGLKQVEEQFTLNFTNGPRDRVNAQINQLHSTLDDLNTVVKAGRGEDAIRQALNTISVITNNARNTVTALPPGTSRDAAQRNLSSVLVEEDQTLRHLLPQVDWPTRLAFTAQLGALGDRVPTVSHVTTLIQSNRTLLLTLTGTNFVSGARLVLDGQPAGIVTGNTQGRLTAVISNVSGLFGKHELGVLNPDGTAAQMAYGKDTDNDQPGDNHLMYGTPEPGDNSGD